MAFRALEHQKTGFVAFVGGMLGDQIPGQVKIEFLSQHFGRKLTKSATICWKERNFGHIGVAL
jgi:hypothetical protein